jgi:aminocarboxymuconate-semialdehyde decarboxylase
MTAEKLRPLQSLSAEVLHVVIIDSHFHWWPRSIFESLCARTSYPRAERNNTGGYRYWRRGGEVPRFDVNAEWFDLDRQLERMDALGHHVKAVCSIGPLSLHFSDLPEQEGHDAAMLWNEEMAGVQRRYSGRLWATAAIPLVSTEVALQVLDHAIEDLGLVGANLPSSIGDDPHIDAERLEPFYERSAELGIPLLLHPTDALFADALSGYGGALHLTLGRVIEVSVAAGRLIFSGIMERHPELKVVMSHTGGFLPYQAGRLNKNGKAARLGEAPSVFLKRMYTDTVSPHAPGIRFAVDYFGADHVMYGSDYPCWNPATALQLFEEIGLSAEDRDKILHDNAQRLFGGREQHPLPVYTPGRAQTSG